MGRASSVLLLILQAVLLLPKSLAQLYKDPGASVEQRVDDLLPRMTLQEKVSQMIQDASNSADRMTGIGSYLIGASDPPDGNTPRIWRQHVNELQAASSNRRLGIPVVVATDAVHGQNIVRGGTVFPHNIGLGMTRNPALLKKIAQVTASEMLSTGLDQTFGPMVAVARTQSWGRTYESYSESTDLVRSYVSSFIQGLQGNTVPWKVVATAKHWIGDGGTINGDDAGDTRLSFEELMDVHGAPFLDAIRADVGVIMVSFSSVNGLKMHQNQHLIENVLKGNLGFQGFVLSDWLGHSTIPGPYDTQIRLAVNAGIDMLMCPYQAFGCYGSILDSVNRGLIQQSRIDDAVRRILRVKFKAGLFEKKIVPIDPASFQPIGSRANRQVARQAVRESLVLLKNNNKLLPLEKGARIFLAGKNADNIQNQCGGWTMSWQGTSNEPRHAIVGGKTIRNGLEQVSAGPVTYSENGTGLDPSRHDVAIVVVGETPYAEGAGDDLDLSLDGFDRTTINNVRSSGLPMVLVVVSGRPMIISDELQYSDAVVAAWLRKFGPKPRP
jgi:beta-glucosidase